MRQRWMIAIFAVAMTLLVIVALVPVPERLGFPLWAVAILLTVVSAGLQFSRRCPRCNAFIGWQSRLALPPACAACGVALRP